MNAHIQSYETKIAPARRRFESQRAVKALLDPKCPAAKLEAFFIHYNALGVRMTEHVESWIERAGRRCTELGYAVLGDALRAHARHEAGHHLMMIEDTRHLVRQHNARLGAALSAEALLGTPATEGVRRYVELHEQTIASDEPFGQLAIEYEIERLSVVVGGPVLERCVQALGSDVMSGLSFLQEHVELDVGHTKLNARALGRFIAEFPDTEDALVRKGEEALEAYAAFVDDCFVLADGLVNDEAARRVSRESPAPVAVISS